MGNNELITRFANLKQIEYINFEHNKPMDDDMNWDIYLLEEEIMSRMSRERVMDYSSFTAS